MPEPRTLADFSPRKWPVGAFFVTQTLEILGVFLGLWYLTLGPGRSISALWDRYLPVWVVFGGALGGSLISLVGVAMHTADWDSSRYAYWHLLRPLLGLISGSAAVIFVLFLLKGIFPDAVPGDGETYTTSALFIMFAISFVVGYREETFRELVKRVVDVILGPGESAATSEIVLIPAQTELKGAAGETVKAQLTLYNRTKDTYAVDDALQRVESDPPAAVIATIQKADTPLGPSDARQVDLEWKVGTASKAMTATVTVRLGGHTASARLKGTVI